MTQNNMANHLHKKFYICIQPTQTNNITKTNANPLVCSDDFLVRYEGLLLRLSHIFVALDTRGAECLLKILASQPYKIAIKVHVVCSNNLSDTIRTDWLFFPLGLV